MTIKSEFHQNSKELNIFINGEFTKAQQSEFTNIYSPYIVEALKITIDFKQADYIDSAAVGLLLDMSDRKSHNTKISLVGARKQIKETIDSTGLVRLLNQ